MSLESISPFVDAYLWVIFIFVGLISIIMSGEIARLVVRFWTNKKIIKVSLLFCGWFLLLLVSLLSLFYYKRVYPNFVFLAVIGLIFIIFNKNMTEYLYRYRLFWLQHFGKKDLQNYNRIIGLIIGCIFLLIGILHFFLVS